jgi:hypothetical protein
MHARLIEMQVEIEELKRKNGDAYLLADSHRSSLAIDRLIDQAPETCNAAPCPTHGMNRVRLWG